MSACLIVGCERRRLTTGALCAPHQRDANSEDEDDERDDETEDGNVTTLETYRAQQADPAATNGDAPKAYECPEPGCTFSSNRTQGLSRHRNQTHGDGSLRASRTVKRHTEPAKKGHAPEPVGFEMTFTLDSEQTDVLAALAFVEERDAHALVLDAVVGWLASEVERDPALAGLAAARARRRR